MGRKFTITKNFGKLEIIRKSEFWVNVGVQAKPFAQKSGQEESKGGVRSCDWSDRVAYFVQLDWSIDSGGIEQHLLQGFLEGE